MRELVGKKSVNLKDLSFEQAEEVLRVQKKNKKRKFCEIAVEMGFIHPKKLIEYPDKSSNSVVINENI